MLQALLQWLDSPFIFIVGLIAALYLIAPLLVMMTQAISDMPQYTPVAPGELGVTREFEHYLAGHTTLLLDHGFEFLGYLRTQSPRNNSTAFVAVLANDSAGQLAQIAFVTATSTGRLVSNKSTGIIIETHYQDGSVLQSATFPESGIYVGRPHIHGQSFHGLLTDLAQLLQVHQFLSIQPPHGATRPSGASANLIDYMTRQHAEVILHQVHNGRYRTTAAAGIYRPTLRGAYLMTWKLLFPWKQIIRARARRRGRQCLKQFTAKHPLPPPISALIP